MLRIGVLALQGDFAAHEDVITNLGHAAEAVRRARDLSTLDALIMPGGESSAMLRLMQAEDLGGAIAERIRGGLPVLATCAGVILLAHGVSPWQPSLGLLDIDVIRNAYGRQVHSAVEKIRLVEEFAEPREIDGVLIRAPRISRVGTRVDILAWFGNDPVLVRQGSIIGATFHPELGRDTRVHRQLLAMTGNDG